MTFSTLNPVTPHTVVEPDTGAPLGEVVLGDAASVDDAVRAARHALPAWRERPVAARADTLEAAAALLDGRVAELAELLARESGKPLAQATFEVSASIRLLRGNAAEGRRLGGRVLPTEGNPGTEGDLAWTRREPLGTVAAILPFNFPVELFVEKCAAALVAGNTVVVKPPIEARWSSPTSTPRCSRAGCRARRWRWSTATARSAPPWPSTRASTLSR